VEKINIFRTYMLGSSTFHLLRNIDRGLSSGGVAALAESMTEAHSTEFIQEKACMVLGNVLNGQFEATAEKMNNRKEAM
jgi:hypothetical protein